MSTNRYCTKCPLSVYGDERFDGIGSTNYGVMIVLPYYTDKYIRSIKTIWDKHPSTKNDVLDITWITALNRCRKPDTPKELVNVSNNYCKIAFINTILKSAPKHIVLMGGTSTTILGNKRISDCRGKYKSFPDHDTFYTDVPGTVKFEEEFNEIITAIFTGKYGNLKKME